MYECGRLFFLFSAWIWFYSPPKPHMSFLITRLVHEDRAQAYFSKVGHIPGWVSVVLHTAGSKGAGPWVILLSDLLSISMAPVGKEMTGRCSTWKMNWLDIMECETANQVDLLSYEKSQDTFFSPFKHLIINTIHTPNQCSWLKACCA